MVEKHDGSTINIKLNGELLANVETYLDLYGL